MMMITKKNENTNIIDDIMMMMIIKIKMKIQLLLMMTTTIKTKLVN
jgi:hypothetical protein